MGAAPCLLLALQWDGSCTELLGCCTRCLLQLCCRCKSLCPISCPLSYNHASSRDFVPLASSAQSLLLLRIISQ